MTSNHALEASAGKMGKLRQQVKEQAFLVEDLENELDHTNLHFRQTTAELEYQKGLVERSRLLEEQQEQSTIDELQYQNHVLQLELQGMYETSKMYDYQEVDEQNRDLRSTISELHQENLQLNHLIAEDGQAAQEREGQTRLFLEREYREQLRDAEGRLKEELFSKLDERTKNIVLQHRRLQDDLFLLKYNIKEFDSRYRQMDDKRRVLNIDNTINKEMNEMMVKEIVGLKKMLKQSEEKRSDQENVISQLRGQLYLQQDGGVARTPEELLSSRTGDSSSSRSSSRTGARPAQGENAQVASLKHEMGRSKKRENLMREQRDMWRSRAFKLELMCSGLQDDLSSAIQAAKTIVNQSDTSVWNASPGPGDGDAVPWLDYDMAEQQEQHQGTSGGRFESSSREDPARGARVSARPASAHPRTGSRLARPGSGRPKPSGSKARPRSALPASGNYHTRSKGGHDGINIRPAPPRPESGTLPHGRAEKDIREEYSYEDSNGTVEGHLDGGAYVGVVPTGGHTMSDPAVSADATAVRQASMSIPEDMLGIFEDEHEESQQASGDGSVLNHLVEPKCHPSSRVSPEITIVGMGGEVTHMSRSVKTSQSSPSRQQYPQHRAQSARPASARPPVSRGRSSGRTVSPSLNHTSPAQSPLPSKQRPVSAVPATMSSQKSSAGIVSRPHSALPSNSRDSTGRSSTISMRRGQSASDFIRSTRTNYMYNGRPFS